MIIWTVTSADQCTVGGTDACGDFPNSIGSGVVRLLLNTNIPTGAPRPITVTVTPLVAPVINIKKSLEATPIKTFFSIKVESYELCNGVPRYKNVCCNSSLSTCFTMTNELEIPIIWNSYFNNKVSIRAISTLFGGVAPNFYTTYSVYETSFDIASNISSFGSISYKDMVFKKVATEYSNLNIDFQLCNNF